MEAHRNVMKFVQFIRDSQRGIMKGYFSYQLKSPIDSQVQESVQKKFIICMFRVCYH